jgi:hypothetical protein
MHYRCEHCGRECASLRNHVKKYDSAIDRILNEIAEKSIDNEEEVRKFEEPTEWQTSKIFMNLYYTSSTKMIYCILYFIRRRRRKILKLITN